MRDHLRRHFFCWLIFLSGCGPTSGFRVLEEASENLQNDFSDICTTLDFSQIDWPDTMSAEERRAMRLGLSITGSFEGRAGWKTITGNFDDMGVSLGLLQQNLGSGSLQPLLILMRNQHSAVLSRIFPAAHLQSLLGMLSRWESAAPTVRASGFSFLDNEIFVLGAAEEQSVQWAVDHLYVGGNFVTTWKDELVALAGTPEFVRLQVQAAMSLHRNAMNMHRFAAVFELRSYLMMFDIMVQNGGLKTVDRTDYSEYVRQNPQASSRERLVHLLNLRLRHVLDQWREDVRLRKMALIDGGGRVHATDRNFEKEFCFNRFVNFQ